MQKKNICAKNLKRLSEKKYIWRGQDVENLVDLLSRALPRVWSTEPNENAVENLLRQYRSEEEKQIEPS